MDHLIQSVIEAHFRYICLIFSNGFHMRTPIFEQYRNILRMMILLCHFTTIQYVVETNLFIKDFEVKEI